MTMLNVGVKVEDGFVKLTRVFVKKGERTINQQTIHIRKSAVVAARGSNRLGYPEHRTTITLSTGADIDVAEKLSDVCAAVGITA